MARGSSSSRTTPAWRRWNAGRVSTPATHAAAGIQYRRYDVTVEGNEGAERLPSETEITLFRIAQEALTNVARHAQAKRISLHVTRNGEQIGVTIEDDGRGFDVTRRRVEARAESRLGLAGMQERATLLGGTLEIESTPGEGTTLFVALPAARDSAVR